MACEVEVQDCAEGEVGGDLGEELEGEGLEVCGWDWLCGAGLRMLLFVDRYRCR